MGLAAKHFLKIKHLMISVAGVTASGMSRQAGDRSVTAWRRTSFLPSVVPSFSSSTYLSIFSCISDFFISLAFLNSVMFLPKPSWWDLEPQTLQAGSSIMGRLRHCWEPLSHPPPLNLRMNQTYLHAPFHTFLLFSISAIFASFCTFLFSRLFQLHSALAARQEGKRKTTPLLIIS